jgi:hypothetical protein
MSMTKTKAATLARDMDYINASLFAKCFRAYLECDDDVQEGIKEMAEIIENPESSEDDRALAIHTIAEALFPGDDSGELGIDIKEADRAAAENRPDGLSALEEIEAEESQFSSRLKEFMESKDVTQAQLAERSGVGQPAISMMLARNCRPQRRTVEKLAKALGVSDKDLWPTKD